MAGLARHVVALLGVVWSVIAFGLSAASFVFGLVFIVMSAQKGGRALREWDRLTAALLRPWTSLLLFTLALFYLATARWPEPFTQLFPVVPPAR